MQKETDIAKNQNTFAKRQREMDKKRKAEDKKKRKLERKLAAEKAATEGPLEESSEGDEAEPEEVSNPTSP